jgi:hypothetical protein
VRKEKAINIGLHTIFVLGGKKTSLITPQKRKEKKTYQN